MKILVSGIKKIKVLFFLIITILIIVSGCFFGTTVENTVTPIIRAIGLPAASAVGSVTLKVTGPGMDPVEVSYSQLPSVINISIPEGNDRTFELTVGTVPAYTGTIATFSGTATASINTNEAVVTLNMGIGSTKIIVPDRDNSRLVQITNMNGDNRITLNGSQLSTLGFSDSNFNPKDIDFDTNGFIYVANNITATYNGVYMFTSLLDLAPVQILSVSNSMDDGMKAVAIDRKNERVYGLFKPYMNSDVVFYNSLTGTPGTGIQFNFITTTFENIWGIAVDNEGNVYLSGQRMNSEPVIEKFSIDGGNSIQSYAPVGLMEPVIDITILNKVLYASKTYSPTVARIEAFNPDTLLHISGTNYYGSYNGNPSNPGEFIGPRNFIATMNDHLTIIDTNSSSFSRIVSLEDLSESGWKTYGSHGSGTEQFDF